jgi:hypothetical protein
MFRPNPHDVILRLRLQLFGGAGIGGLWIAFIGWFLLDFDTQGLALSDEFSDAIASCVPYGFDGRTNGVDHNHLTDHR